MGSEQRLHPATLLFDIAGHLRQFALPAVLLMLGASRTTGPMTPWGRVSSGWEVWLLVLLVPAVIASVLRYLTFRLRYDGRELVIGSGLIFRNERHVPFARIQNLDAVQNPVHRMLGVVEIRVETGGGDAEEARLSVLPLGALAEMRRRVFEGRPAEAEPVAAAETVADAQVTPPAAAEPEVLLHMPIREVLLCGVLQNKGLVLIGAAYGMAWDSGLLNWMGRGLFDEGTYSGGLLRESGKRLFEGEGLPFLALAVGLAGFTALLVFVRLVSMVWALVRLYGFRLTRVREDLRLEFGLFTLVAATIPIRRVQAITIRQGPFHRWLNRASVNVETAGGPGGEAGSMRELAPLIRVEHLPALLQQVLPGFDMGAVNWRHVHPRAFRRAVKPRLIVTTAVTVTWAAVFGWTALAALAVMLTWAIVGTRQYVKYLRWAEHDEAVLLRSGWVWQRHTLARANRIQAVSLRQSPFDRRAAMARVRVDTAGAGMASHRVDIPYLDRGVASQLAGRLAAQAASTAFRW